MASELDYELRAKGERGITNIGSCYQIQLLKITPTARGPEQTDAGHTGVSLYILQFL